MQTGSYIYIQAGGSRPMAHSQLGRYGGGHTQAVHPHPVLHPVLNSENWSGHWLGGIVMCVCLGGKVQAGSVFPIFLAISLHGTRHGYLLTCRWQASHTLPQSSSLE